MEDNFVMIDIKWNSKNKMGIINDYTLVEEMREKYKIVCEPIGTPAISKKQNKLLIGPYMLNKYDLFFLYENKHIIINSQKNLQILLIKVYNQETARARSSAVRAGGS